MNKLAVARELAEVAKLIGSREVTAEEVREICPECADKMAREGIASVPETIIAAAIREAALKEADKWTSMPKGWTKESVESFWNSLTGDRKHKITQCMKKMEGHVSDTGAFCGALARRVFYR